MADNQTPYNQVMGQARDLNRNLLTAPPPFLPFDPNVSTTNNMLRGLLAGISGIMPGGRTSPHIMARNIAGNPPDSIPTITGGGPNRPYGSNDIAQNNFGINHGNMGEYYPLGGQTPTGLNDNAPVFGARLQDTIRRLNELTSPPTKPPTKSDIPVGGPPSNELEVLRGLFRGENTPNQPNLSTTTNRNVDLLGDAASRMQAGKLPAPLSSNVEAISNWFEQSGVPHRIENRGLSHYIIGTDNSGSPVYVRVPEDAHVGRPARSNQEIGSRFDTGSVPAPNTRNPLGDPRILNNESGQPYSDLSNLWPSLQHRFSTAPNGGNWLIPPGQAPNYRQPNITTQDMLNVLRDPNQLNFDLNAPHIPRPEGQPR